MKNAILQALKSKKPAFQLKSGSSGIRSSEQLLSKLAQSTEGLERASVATGFNVLEFVSETVTSRHVSIETGGGWSTCVFASGGGRHYCVNPDLTANQLIREFLQENNCPAPGLEFLPEPSDIALPRLAPDLLFDIAYIDGNHSYPMPIVDWHYLDAHLKQGGVLLVDDVQIRAVRVLCEFLATEPAYRLQRKLGTTWVYEKVAPEREWGWSGQAFNKPGPTEQAKAVVKKILGRP